MSEPGVVVLLVAAIVAIGIMFYAVSFGGFDPSAIACWLELTCRT